jgi:predicted TIM-barrel enzyme
LTRKPSPCYAFALDEAKAVAEDGTDAVVADSGVTTKGSSGATTATFQEEAPPKGYRCHQKIAN